MSDNVARPGGRIFISYRREETAYPAGWLYDRLRVRYAGQVFKDVDSIEPGDDFVEAITRAVASCDVLLALIGDQWLTVTSADGRRRIDDPEDFVRVEIEAALTRNVRVIPILIDGARMPRSEELPENLARLVRRQALDLSPSRFDSDLSRLLKVLDATLLEMRDPPRSNTAVLRGTETEQSDRGAAADPHRPPPVHREPDAERRRRPRPAVIGGATGGVVVIALVISAVLLRSPETTPILSEDFTSQANGWKIASDWTSAKATYVPGAYRLSVPADDEGAGAWAFPVNATQMVPTAPQNLRVEVDGRILPAADKSTEYGVVCRSGGHGGYILAVAGGHARIVRVGSSDVYQMLEERDAPVDTATINRIRAECTTVDGERAVHLALSVNGQKVAAYIDTNDPLLNGTSGLHVRTLTNATRAGAAEFYNFTVTEI